jgi:hypothetical protein
MAARQSGTRPRPSTATVPDTKESSAPTADTASPRPPQPSDSTWPTEGRLHSSTLQRGNAIARLGRPATTGTPARQASAASSPSRPRDAEDGHDRSESAPSSRRPSAPTASRSSAGGAARRHLSSVSSPSPSVARSSPVHTSASARPKHSVAVRHNVTKSYVGKLVLDESSSALRRPRCRVS